MLISPIPTPLMQELSAGHALAMQCGARASQFLDRAAAAGWDERANLEALRMTGLTARLMEGVQRMVPRVRGAAAAASASAPASPPAVAASAVRPAGSAAPKRHAAPGQRRGCLKNGNPSGDYLPAPRCGARTRAGCACRQPAMANGRCRMHGGLSTGPRTPEGLARSRAARLTHGYRTRELIGLRSRAAHAARRLRGLNRALSAGHGVHRSDSIDASRDARTDVRTDCGPAPTNGADRTRPAGHGVHRSDSINRKDAKLVLGPAKGRTRGAQSSRAISSSASSRLCGESTVRNGTVSAGHGLHRSFRDSLRSSVAGAA